MPVGDNDRDRVREQFLDALCRLRTLDAGREVALFVVQRRPKVKVSARLKEFGWGALTIGMLNTILITPEILNKTTDEAIRTYAHEFGHLLFGKDRPVECTIDSIEQEYAAEILAARVWVEMNPGSREEYEWILNKQPVKKKAAYERIRQQWGDYYEVLPEKQPRWYQIWLYWPAVAYILRIALRVVLGLRQKGDV